MDDLGTCIMKITPDSNVRKKILDDVYILEYAKMRKPLLVHECNGDSEWYTRMTTRDNNEGPMYWCPGCGYVLPEGPSMAVMMYELEI
ncbi:MAG: hypothetical protein ACWGQW_18960 [bacterium]